MAGIIKESLEAWLRERGYAVRDLGTDSEASTDYADYAHPLAQQVSEGEAERGVLLCGTGLGMSYVANRYPHVRAADRLSPRAVIGTIIGLHTLVLLAPPLLSTDVFSYEIYGRMGALYGTNAIDGW